MGVYFYAWELVSFSKKLSSMLKDFVITLQSFKENNGKCRNWLCVYACDHFHVACPTPLLSEVRKSRKGQNSTLISSTYGWVSHISLIRFIGISVSPKIVRVWKNGCLEGPLISEPSALLTRQTNTEEVRPFFFFFDSGGKSVSRNCSCLVQHPANE